MSARFSFTRSVSKEIYERQCSKSNLTDGCTPIIIFETDSIIDSLNRATKRNLQLHRAKPVDSGDIEDPSN